MQNNVFTILAIMMVLFGLILSLVYPLAGLFTIGTVLVGGVILLVVRLMKR